MARFWIWLFSSCIDTTTPVGLWVMRTAESVVFTLWPPGPDERYTSTWRSFGSMWNSTSSASGSTVTVAELVCTRPWLSVTGTRWTRWTPPSCLRCSHAPSPLKTAVTSLSPPRSVGALLRSSSFQPWREAKATYIS